MFVSGCKGEFLCDELATVREAESGSAPESRVRVETDIYRGGQSLSGKMVA